MASLSLLIANKAYGIGEAGESPENSLSDAGIKSQAFVSSDVDRDDREDVPVTQPENVSHHGHDGQGARVVGPPVKPHLHKRDKHIHRAGNRYPCL